MEYSAKKPATIIHEPSQSSGLLLRMLCWQMTYETKKMWSYIWNLKKRVMVFNKPIQCNWAWGGYTSIFKLVCRGTTSLLCLGLPDLVAQQPWLLGQWWQYFVLFLQNDEYGWSTVHTWRNDPSRRGEDVDMKLWPGTGDDVSRIK